MGDNVRVLFPMYDTPMQCVALKKSGVTSFRQLDGKTVGLFNFSIANKDMSDELAYAVTRTILENNAATVRARPAARDMIAANAALLQGKGRQARPGSSAEVGCAP